jgi:hypothetical protein
MVVDRTVPEGQADEERDRELAAAGNDNEDEDADMGENPRSRRDRYLQSSMEEVSDPDEWAELH